MQTNSQLNIDPKVGKAVSQIPTTWFKFVNNVLKYLSVENGEILAYDDKWQIVVNKEKTYGAPSPYKVIAFAGYKKISNTSSWQEMTASEIQNNPPTRTQKSFVDGTDAYPWYAIAQKWDYVRAVALPES